MRDLPGHFTHDVTGKPLAVGDLTIVPSIRASGWSLGFVGPAGGAAGWTMHVAPRPVAVTGADGQTTTLRLPSPTGRALRAMAGIGLGVAVLCGLVIVAVKRR